MIDIEKVKDICADAIVEMSKTRKNEFEEHDPLIDLLLMNEDMALISTICKKLQEFKN